MAQPMDEFDASLVGLYPFLFNDLVDQVVLAVPEPAHCISVWRIFRASFGELDAPRREKIANAVEARLPVDIEPVIGSEIERMKCLSSLLRTLLQVLIKHLLPTGRVYARGVGDHTIKVEQDSVVVVMGNCRLALGLPRRSHSGCFAHGRVLPIFNPRR